jgi:hypothetical protein
MAAVRQKEMKVNITLVTTSTCRVVGPRRRGLATASSAADIEWGFPDRVDIVASAWLLVQRSDYTGSP